MVNKINGLTQAQGTAPRRDKAASRNDAADRAASPSPSPGENVTLSQEAQTARDVESKIGEFPEVNAERVAHLRDALRNGEYEVDPARLAAKIVQFELDI